MSDALATALWAALEGVGSLAVVMTRVDQRVFDDAQLSDVLFEPMLGALRSPRLFSHPEAVSLVKVLEDQGGLLRPAQKRLVVEAMPSFVASVQDEIAAFLAVELWASWADPQDLALEGLRSLSRVAPHRLPVIVHGFDWLWKEARDAGLARRCHGQLALLVSHIDPVVSAEATAAIARREMKARS